MTHDNIVAENGLFDFEAFKKEAAKRMKAGQPLTGESGILTPLIKKIVEASLDAEIEQHMEDCDETGVANGKCVNTPNPKGHLLLKTLWLN